MNKIKTVAGSIYQSHFYIRYNFHCSDGKIVCQVRGHKGNKPYGQLFVLRDISDSDKETAALNMVRTNSLEKDDDGLWYLGLLRFENDYNPRIYFGVETVHITSTYATFADPTRESTYIWFKQELKRLKKGE